MVNRNPLFLWGIKSGTYVCGERKPPKENDDVQTFIIPCKKIR